MLEALANGRVVVEEKLNERRWLDIGQVLVGQAGHRAFEGFDHARRLQRILVGLVLDGPAQAIAQGHNDETKDGGQHKHKRDGRGIGQALVIVLRVNSPV
jgi:hypothetical protein